MGPNKFGTNASMRRLRYDANIAQKSLNKSNKGKYYTMPQFPLWGVQSASAYQERFYVRLEQS